MEREEYDYSKLIEGELPDEKVDTSGSIFVNFL